MRTHDINGKRFPNQRVPDFTHRVINDADVYGIFEPILLHGPLPTPLIVPFAQLYRKNATNIQLRLGHFFTGMNLTYRGRQIAGPVIDRPPRQFPPLPGVPDRKQTIIHALNDRSIAILNEAGRYRAIKHGGWFEHQVAKAMATASFHLYALRIGARFTTPDIVGEGAAVPYTHPNGIQYDDHFLVPDYNCALQDYFSWEMDLGTETGRPASKSFPTKKSYMRMFLQYGELHRGRDKLYSKLWNIPQGKEHKVLFLTTERSKLDLMGSIIKETTDGRGCPWFLMKYVPRERFSMYHSPTVIEEIWTEPWKRVGYPEVRFKQPQ